jgi:type VI secretion system protein ImpL
MTRKLKIGLSGITSLVTFAGGGWILGSFLGLQGRDLWVLRGGIGLLGCIVTAVLVGYLIRRRAGPPKPVADEGRDIDTALAAARARLVKSRVAGGLEKLPVVLVVGPEGSAKTTTVVRSGIEPELLAGEVYHGETIAPTRLVNVWYSQRALFIEAGGRVTSDPARWQRLVSQMQPGRLRAALAGGAHAPRVALVCLSCEDLLRSDRAESVPAAARALRSRLSDLAYQLGVRVPLYVLFTKADRIPHFADYVRNFSREEVGDVFGSTLRLEPVAADTYADRSYKRIDRAFQRLFHSIASKRLKFLPRENQPEIAASAYEFPREFRKVIQPATQFLIELCRPSQLEVSPVLRGFYFVGVRPVVVTDAPFEAAATASATSESPLPVGATSVFNLGQPRAALAAKLSPSAPTSRKVPQWLFLERLLPEVVLSDRMAMAMTQGGRRVDLLRRMVLSVVALLGLLVAGVFALSYDGNRRLQQSVVGATQGLVSRGAIGADGVPMEDALRRLDVLRGELDTLGRYEREGPPWRLRSGLYAGSALYPPLRRRYFTEMDRLLLRSTRDSLLTFLRSLPSTPTQGSDYGAVYTALKAYLITTLRPDQSTVEFLGPALVERWRGTRSIDPGRLDLAARQFGFYAAELPHGDPFDIEPDTRTVSHTRAFLGKFTGAEPIYRSMLAAVSAKARPVEYARIFPNALSVVRAPHIVPGAFTRDGWAAMQVAFKDVDRYFRGEGWVIGDQAPVTADRAKVVQQVRGLYIDEYIDQWRRFLAAASVERSRGVQDGARKLALLGSNQSPLLALFSLVSRHTAVDTLAIAPAFQAAHVVTPPADTAKYIGESNEGYMNALVALQASLEQVAKGGAAGGEMAVGQALADAAQARLATKQVANKFRIDNEGRVHTMVQRLMEAPIVALEPALMAVGPAELNGKGRAFCAPFQQVMVKYPFSPSGVVPASVDEVSALLQPGTGALWTFVDNELPNYVVRHGTQFAEKPGSPVRISAAFISFVNRAAEFSTALYGAEGSSPRLSFTMRPILSEAVPGLTVTIDGKQARFTRTSAASKPVVWTAAQGQEATLSARLGGRDQQVLTYRGTWAIFKLFNQAEWYPGDNFYTVEWSLPGTAASGKPLRATFDVHLAGAKPVLKRNFFAGVSCNGRIAR